MAEITFLAPNMVLNQGFCQHHFHPKVRSIEGLPITSQLLAPMAPELCSKLYADIAGQIVLPKIVFDPGILAKIWVAVARCPGEVFIQCLVRSRVVPVKLSPGVLVSQLEIVVYAAYCPDQTSSHVLFFVHHEDSDVIRQAIKRDHGSKAQFHRQLHLHSHMRGTDASTYDFDEYAAIRGARDFLVSCIVDKNGRLEATFWAWKEWIFGHQLVIFDCPWMSASDPAVITGSDIDVGEEFARRVVFDPLLKPSSGMETGELFEIEDADLPSSEMETGAWSEIEDAEIEMAR